jgi:hypothetical protein
MHLCACTRTSAGVPTVTHTHRPISNTCCFSTATIIRECASMLPYTRWFKYDRDNLCVNKSQFVPVIFEPPCTTSPLLFYFLTLFQKRNCSIKQGLRVFLSTASSSSVLKTHHVSAWGETDVKAKQNNNTWGHVCTAWFTTTWYSFKPSWKVAWNHCWAILRNFSCSKLNESIWLFMLGITVLV